MTEHNGSTIHFINNLSCFMVVYLRESWSFALGARLDSGLDEMSGAMSGTELLIIYVSLFWTLLLGFLSWLGHSGRSVRMTRISLNFKDHCVVSLMFCVRCARMYLAIY